MTKVRAFGVVVLSAVAASNLALAVRAEPGSPWCESGVAPRAAMRPAGKARRPRIPGVFEGGATRPGGMQRWPNAAGVAPRAACREAVSSQSNQRPPARTPDIHFVPTRQSVADAMLQLARVNANDLVYDLGSGDGRIVITAAQKYGARGVGIELDPRLVRISRETALEGAVEHKATFIEGDLFTADISPATVVTLYLSLTVNMRLESKLKRELRPGTRIVSQRFPIGTWKPDISTTAEGEQLFLWTIPER